MRAILWLALVFSWGLIGCAAGPYYYPPPSHPSPSWYEGPSVPGPWIYNHDPTLGDWYRMPYYNPYQQ